MRGSTSKSGNEGDGFTMWPEFSLNYEARGEGVGVEHHQVIRAASGGCHGSSGRRPEGKMKCPRKQGPHPEDHHSRGHAA